MFTKTCCLKLYMYEYIHLNCEDTDTVFFFICRFRPVIVKETIHNVLNEHLTGKTYDTEETTEWTRRISDDIKLKLKGRTS